MQKRSFQTQIHGLEQELIQLRLNLSSLHKERDEMKLRLQNEIIKMEQKFSDAQVEIQNLRSHVDILKSSYATIIEDLDGDDDSKSDVESELEGIFNHAV